METITSPHNPRVKAAIKLRDRRARDKQGRILIDGVREIGRALAAGVSVVEAFIAPERCQTPECQALVEQLNQRSTALFSVGSALFDRVAYGARAEGVLAVAEPPERHLADLQLVQSIADREAAVCVAVLEGLEKPGNVGAVLRSADAAGVAAVIVADPATDLYNPNCIRASLGTVFTLPICAATSAQTLAWLQAAGLTVFAARVDGAADYRQVRFGRRAAIVLGSEAAGLSSAWRAAEVRSIQLPMLGAADSLNVSATAAVLFYEALRQRETL